MTAQAFPTITEVIRRAERMAAAERLAANTYPRASDEAESHLGRAVKLQSVVDGLQSLVRKWEAQEASAAKVKDEQVRSDDDTAAAVAAASAAVDDAAEAAAEELSRTRQRGAAHAAQDEDGDAHADSHEDIP